MRKLSKNLIINSTIRGFGIVIKSLLVKMWKLNIIELGFWGFGESVNSLMIKGDRAKTVATEKDYYRADAVISGADYHFTETRLLPEECRSYSDRYWKKKVMAPSCLLYYVGLNKKLKNLQHHSLFFDVPFDKHGKEIYSDPKWPTDPLFYVSVSSLTEHVNGR